MKIGIVTTWFERGAAYVSRQYRDVLAQKVPVVLYEDVYAMASVVGGIVICVLYPLTGIVYASWGGFGAVLLLRICAILFGWRLYHPARTHGSGSGSRE